MADQSFAFGRKASRYFCFTVAGNSGSSQMVIWPRPCISAIGTFHLAFIDCLEAYLPSFTFAYCLLMLGFALQHLVLRTALSLSVRNLLSNFEISTAVQGLLFYLDLSGLHASMSHSGVKVLSFPILFIGSASC